MAVRGLTIPIGADAREFNKEIRSMNTKTRQFKREVGDLSKALEIEWDEKRFVLAQEKARQAVEQTDIKIQALKDRLKELDEMGESQKSNHYQKIQRDLSKAETEAVLLKHQLQEIDKLKMERLSKSFEEAGSKIEGAGKKLSAFSAAAAGILASFSAIGLSAVKRGGELDDVAQQVGMTAEAYQKFEYIAMQTGSSIDRLQRAFTVLRTSTGQALLGETNKSTEALQQLGFTLHDLQNMSQEDIFYSTLIRLSEMEDETMKVAVATKVFNERIVADIMPTLNAGAQGIEELNREIEELGYLSNEQVLSLANFDDGLLRLKVAFTDVKNQIGAAMLPVLGALSNFVETKVLPALRKFADWFKNLSENQMLAITGTLAFVAALGPALLIIGKMTSGIGGLIRSFQGLSGALSSLSAHPIIAIIGLIAVLIGVLYAKNEEFRESINKLIGVLGTALTPILETVMGLFKTLIDALMPIINLIGDILTPVIDALATSFSMLGPILQISTIPLQTFAKTLEVVFKLIIPIIKIIGELANVIMKILGPVLDWITEKVNSVINKIMGWVEDGVNWIIDKINWIIDKINILGKVLGFELDRINEMDFSPSVKTQIETSEGQTQTYTGAEAAIAQSTATYGPTTTIDNDYSTKNITVNLTIENYGEELDYDDVVNQINLRLAEQM